MSTIPTNRESDRFMLRLPDGMRDRIKTAAEANNRSMNAEIVARLQATFEAHSKDMQRRIKFPREGLFGLGISPDTEDLAADDLSDIRQGIAEIARLLAEQSRKP